MGWLTINTKSNTLHMPVVIQALIPEKGKNFKVLYLLNPEGGDNTSWLLKTRIADYVENTDIAVIMPSGKNKYFVDNFHGRDYAKFVSEELIEKTEQIFDVSRKKNDRYIAGASMGAYGAAAAALDNKDKYNTAFLFSGILDIVKKYDTEKAENLYPVFGNRQDLINNNYDLVEKIKSTVDNETKFVINCGLDDKNIDANKKTARIMGDNLLNVSSIFEQGGHDWKYWDKCIERAIDIIKTGEQ